jgi:flagellar L-ring protein FlgH
MSTRTSKRTRRGWIDFTVGLAIGTAAMAIGFNPSMARAQVFGKKVQEDYSATRAQPVAAPVANGSIFQPSDGYAALYEGQRARRVGDPLTIVLVERTAASKSAASQLDSRGGFGITPPTAGPLDFLDPNSLRASGNRNFQGQGSADQANALSGEVSVTVHEVYPNGTMLVQGQKRVTLNRGDEFVQIKGIVRTIDVDASNRVASTRVADAKISYTGKGDVARASRQGWLSRFFQVVSPF